MDEFFLPQSFLPFHFSRLVLPPPKKSTWKIRKNVFFFEKIVPKHPLEAEKRGEEEMSRPICTPMTHGRGASGLPCARLPDERRSTTSPSEEGATRRIRARRLLQDQTVPQELADFDAGTDTPLTRFAWVSGSRSRRWQGFQRRTRGWRHGERARGDAPPRGPQVWPVSAGEEVQRGSGTW